MPKEPEEKPRHKLTLKLAAFNQDDLDRLLANVQEFAAENGIEVEGEYTRTVPFEWRIARERETPLQAGLIGFEG